jgi:hypothetical protein
MSYFILTRQPAREELAHGCLRDFSNYLGYIASLLLG